MSLLNLKLPRARPSSIRSDPLRVVVVGPLPEPYNGMTVITGAILSSPLSRRFDILHIDTSDHRPIDNVGRLDVTNVTGGLRAALSVICVLGRGRVEIFYLPIAKQRLPFLRDALFLTIARAGRKAVVVHLHAEGFSDFWRSEARWMRLLIRACMNSDHLHAIVVGESLRSEFDGLVNADRVHVLPNGTVDYGGRDGHVGGTPPPHPAILYLTTLWSAKGVFELLESTVRLRRQIPGVRVVLAGGWYSASEAAQARKFVRENHLQDSIRFLGPVGSDAKRALLSTASVLALPSHTEGHPLVILEALSAGVPVVATRVGAVSATITDGIEGFLVDVGDVDALTDRLARVLASPPLRAAMGRLARERYEREFSMDQFTDGLGDIWLAAAGSGRHRIATSNAPDTRSHAEL